MIVKRWERITLAVLLLSALAAAVNADVVGESPYDQVFDIYVETCGGERIVYRDCVVTNVGQWVVSFIPDQGRIATGNGREIIVHKNLCASVVMVAKYD